LGLLVCVLGLLAHHETLWLDELSSYWLSNAPSLSEVFTRMLARGDPHPPGFQVLLHFWLKVPWVPEYAFAIRGFSILAESAGVALMAALTWRVSKSVPATVLVAILCAGAGSSLFYGVELRSYALQHFALALLLFCRDASRLDAQPTKASAGMVAGAFVLGTSHYVGALVCGCVFLLDATNLIRKRSRSLARWTTTTLLLVGPFFALAWLLVAADHGGFKRTLSSPGLDTLLYFRKALYAPQHDLLLGVLVLSVLLFFFKKSPALEEKSTWADFDRIGLPACALAIFLLAGISLFKPILQVRNVVFALPCFLAAASVLLARLNKGTRVGQALLVLLALGFLGLGANKVHRQLAKPARYGEDFWLTASVAQGMAVVNRDDIANKLRDAARIRTAGRRPLKVPQLRYLSARVGGTNLVNVAALPSQITLLCPACRADTRLRLLHFVRDAGHFCVPIDGLARADKAWYCLRQK
jgi:hypothetical protein